MEPKFVQKPAFTVVGVVHRGPMGNPDIPKLWGVFNHHMADIPNIINPRVCYGAQDHFDEATGEFDYLAACETPPGSRAPEGMHVWDVAAANYAVFPTTLATIHDSYHYIYGTWLPQSGYQRASGVEFELYDESFNPDDPNSTFYLYVPVVAQS